MTRLMKCTPSSGKFDAYEFYDGFDGGVVVLREWRRAGKQAEFAGQVLAHTSYGSYGYTWTHMGCDLRRFLVDAVERKEIGYIMGKIAGASRDAFDPDLTIRDCKRRVRELRRAGGATKENARAAFDVLADLDGSRDDREFYERLDETVIFRDDTSGYFRHSITADCRGFWDNIMKPLAAQFQREFEAAANADRDPADEARAAA